MEFEELVSVQLTLNRDKVMNESLPGDGFGRGCFDTLPRFVVGDPSARFETHTPLTYETNGETGQPLWKEILGHILKECAYLKAFQTVYVMVDTRNLKAHETSQDGLPHWPAAVAWWHSRVQLVGSHHERTELLYFPATEETGLHRVHPTWAGTFVPAALVAVFPGINFILLDSDCLPITLFEAADLWKEGFLARFPLGSRKGLPQQHPLHRRRDFVNRPDVVYTQHRVNADGQGQGVLLVTEPHSELNAGLVVVFSSAHNPQEKQQWIQSGLALSPLVGTCTQYSVDFCLAWALIGECVPHPLPGPKRAVASAWTCALPMGLMPGTASEPGLHHPLIRCTLPMSLMLGPRILFIFPSTLCRNFLLPPFCCLIHFC